MLSTILKFLSGGALEQVANLFKDYQDKKLTKEELRFRLETFEEQNKQDIMLAQVELNKTEAESDHWFVAAWRPFIGWVCVVVRLLINILNKGTSDINDINSN